jgi:hypothetical protein
MGGLGTSKELAPFWEESLENFPAAQTLTRDSPIPFTANLYHENIRITFL